MKRKTLATIQTSNIKNSRNALSEIIMLHNKGILTDAEFTNIVQIISAEYVGYEIERRLTTVMNNAFSNHPLFGGILCPMTHP
jgi:hypothetical protein